MSASSFNTIRRHSSDATGIRIKELTQELARQRSQLEGSSLETDDVRSQGRMDHSTIKLNDERLNFVTTISTSTDEYFEFPTEPDFDKLKVWFMLDHLGSKMHDLSGFANHAIISGHPTLRREPLDLGFQQIVTSAATPVMLFNSGTDVVSQTNGEYIWIPDHNSIKFTLFSVGFSIAFRFNCLDFNNHISEFGTFLRRFASKADDTTNGWHLVVYPTNPQGSAGGLEMNIVHNNLTYKRRSEGYLINTWYQVIVTYNPSLSADLRVKIYKEGTENSLSGITELILPSQPNLRIGARSANTGFFYGYIHDFRLYMDKVLTQTEVTNLNNNELTIDNIPKSRVFIIQYAKIAQPMSSKTHKYHMNGKVKTRYRIHKFNIVNKITTTKTHRFKIAMFPVSTIKTHKWISAGKVSTTKTHKFNLVGTLTQVVKTKTHKYNIVTKVTATKTHKYNIGTAPLTELVTFNKSTTAGSNITQEVAFSSTPQALIVFSNGSSNPSGTFSSDYQMYYGFSDGTHHACISGLSHDAIPTSDTFSGNKNNRVISLMDQTTGTVASEATVAFSTNKATFTWTTNDNRAVKVAAMALYNHTKVEVKSFTTGTTSTGNQTYTLNDTSISPKLVHVISNNGTAGWSADPNQLLIGAAVSSSNQFAVSCISEDNQSSMDTRTYSDNTSLLVGLNPSDSSINTIGKFVSAGTGNGQFTINWSDAPASSTMAFHVLVVESNNLDVLSVQDPTTTGNQTVTTGANVNNVKGVIAITPSKTSPFNADEQTPDNSLSIGAVSGSGTSVTHSNFSSVDIDSLSDSDAVRLYSGTLIRVIYSSPTSLNIGTATNLGTDQFIVNWNTADTGATRRTHYIVFGSG